MAGYLQDQLWIRKVPSEYSPTQVAQYLSTIGVFIANDSDTANSQGPNEISKSDAATALGRLETLERVVKHHLLSFPFENTAMHYTAERKMDVTSQGLFNRLVLERKGSFCLGQNTILLGMLRGLGFRAYAGFARVNRNWQSPTEKPSYGSQSHMIVFVQPFEGDNKTYVVDVGFGGSGLVRPIPLVSGAKSTVMGVALTEFHRLVKEPFPHSSLGTHSDSIIPAGRDVWNLEVQHLACSLDTHSPWKRVYSFTEQEFFPTDCEDTCVMVTKILKLFTENVLCIRYILDEESHLCRIVMFGREVKMRRTNGETEILATLNTDLDRVKALRDIFRIDIHDSAVQHIAGTLAELKCCPECMWITIESILKFNLYM